MHFFTFPITIIFMLIINSFLMNPSFGAEVGSDEFNRLAVEIEAIGCPGQMVAQTINTLEMECRDANGALVMNVRAKKDKDGFSWRGEETVQGLAGDTASQELLLQPLVKKFAGFCYSKDRSFFHMYHDGDKQEWGCDFEGASIKGREELKGDHLVFNGRMGKQDTAAAETFLKSTGAMK